MFMKLAICAVSLGALVCAVIGLVNWDVSSVSVEGAINVAGLLALLGGMLSVGYAANLKATSWTTLLTILTVGGVVTFCGSAINEGLNNPSWAGSLAPESPAILQQSHLVMLAPIAVVALAAVLCALLLRPSEPQPAKPVKPAKPEDPPASVS